MMRATRMASAKIKAKAKSNLGFLKSLGVEAFDLREDFARGADRTAMVTSFVAESFASSSQSKLTGAFGPKKFISVRPKLVRLKVYYLFFIMHKMF